MKIPADGSDPNAADRPVRLGRSRTPSGARKGRIRHLPIALLSALLSMAALPAAASVIVNGSMLEITFGPGTLDVGIETGPAPGVVRLNGVPGVPDGTVFSGIDRVRYATGAGGDFIQLRQSGSMLPAIEIVSSVGGVFLDAEIDVPSTSAAVVSSLNVRDGAGNSRIKSLVKSKASSLTLDWATVLGAGQHEVEQNIVAEGSSARLDGGLVVALGTGASKTKTSIKSEADLVDLDLQLNAGSSGELDLVVEHLRSGGLANARVDLSGARKLAWKWVGQSTDLALDGRIRGSSLNEEFNAEIEAVTSGILWLDAANGTDKVNVLLKGASSLVGTVAGGAGNDEIKVVVDGPNSGAITVDGGPGSDKCEGPNAIVRCEF